MEDAAKLRVLSARRTNSLLRAEAFPFSVTSESRPPCRSVPFSVERRFLPSGRSVFLAVQTISRLRGEALCLYTGRPCQLCTENASVLHEERNASTRRKCQVNTENKAILHEEKTKSPCRRETVLRVDFAAMRTKKERAGALPRPPFGAVTTAAPGLPPCALGGRRHGRAARDADGAVPHSRGRAERHPNPCACWRLPACGREGDPPGLRGSSRLVTVHASAPPFCGGVVGETCSGGRRTEIRRAPHLMFRL